MIQEHRDKIEDYACEKSCSPSDAEFIKGYVNFGYNLAESHYKAMLDRMATKAKSIISAAKYTTGYKYNWNLMSGVEHMEAVLTEYEQLKTQS